MLYDDHRRVTQMTKATLVKLNIVRLYILDAILTKASLWDGGYYEINYNLYYYRECYMSAGRYLISLWVLRNISLVCCTHLWNIMFSKLLWEEKFCISKWPCHFLFIMSNLVVYQVVGFYCFPSVIHTVMCNIVLIHTCDIICVDLLPLRILLKVYILININIQSFQRVLNSLTMKFTSKFHWSWKFGITSGSLYWSWFV